MTGGEADGLPPEVRDLLEDREDGDELRRIWQLLGRGEEGRAYDVDGEWAELERELDDRRSDLRLHGAGEGADRPGGGILRRLAVSRPAAAAAALALALLGAGAWWLSTPATATAPPGRQATVTLPDGSTARLNADSRIRWDRGFAALPWTGASARRVRLRGEAHFSVREGDRRFRVTTPNASVEVLGTEFTVRARRTGEAGEGPAVTEVVLASGRLEVTSRGAGGRPESAVRLTRPGERSRVVDGRRPSAPTTVDLERATAWIDGGFSMTDASVAAVVRELERRFDAEIRLRARDVADEVVTLHYGSGVAVEEVLSDLAVLVGLKYRRTSGGFELFRE